jgi:hypothetical protein
MKNKALWKRAGAEAWVQLAVSCGLLAAFGWLFVWLMSLFKMGTWATLLNLLPDFVQPMFGVPLADLATASGRLSFLYVHVITLLVCIGWAVGRGSDAVSGRIARGTMELLLTLPVWRVTVLAIPSVVSTVGAAALAVSVWAGSCLGLLLVDLGGVATPWQFLPGVANLFAMTFCLTGATTFLSSWDYDRWRTIWLSGGFFVISAILEMVSRLWEPGAWLRYASFLAAFEPQRLILMKTGAWEASLWCDGTLVGLGLLGYLAAGVVFTVRDVPVSR